MALDVYRNSKAGRRGDYPFGHILSVAEAAKVHGLATRCPLYQPTPLHRLHEAARQLGIAQLYYKDESRRFGLTSFKSLGGPYAVGRVLGQILGETGRPLEFSELLEGKAQGIASHITVATASDGNHGRAVAAGARLFGCRCVVFLHEGVSAAREQAILELGSQVVRTQGHYDESVAEASRMAAEQGWLVLADTSDDPADAVPIMVMQGYTVMAREILDQLAASGEQPPTHIVLQGGVGALAAGIVSYYWEALGPQRAPTFIIVEPDRADCLFQSACAGRPTRSEGDLGTVMAGLACGEISLVAWPIVTAAAEYFVKIPDDNIADTMRLLASGSLGVAIEAGETGCVGVAALRAVGTKRLGMDADARVLVIGTEGASDPAIYEAIVGAFAA